MAEHRIVVTGHSGIRKDEAIERLAKYIFQRDTQWKQLRGSALKQRRLDRENELIAWQEGEETLKRKTDVFRGNFLYHNDPKRRYEVWLASLQDAMEKLNRSKAETKCLILNASFYSQSQFFSPLFWSLHGKADPWKILTRFKPTQFINLYDNIFYARELIKEPYQFAPSELLHWRNIELLFTDLLSGRLIPDTARLRIRERYRGKPLDAYYPFERATYLAVGHPVETLYKLLFDERSFRIYLSFPITEPKAQFQRSARVGISIMDQIDDFRREMSKRFIALDPLTIEELTLQTAFRKARRNQRTITVDLSATAREVWPSAYKTTLCGERPQKQVTFRRDELESISREQPTIKDVTGGPFSSELDYQVASRDFRLIDQSDGVIVYRPGLMKDL